MGIRTALFKMYNDDAELYYTGFLTYRIPAEGEELVVAGPLADFGMPDAGCTSIEYPATSSGPWGDDRDHPRDRARRAGYHDRTTGRPP